MKAMCEWNRELPMWALNAERVDHLQQTLQLSTYELILLTFAFKHLVYATIEKILNMQTAKDSKNSPTHTKKQQ